MRSNTSAVQDGCERAAGAAWIWCSSTWKKIRWDSTLHVSTRRLSALNGVPSSRMGQLTLPIANEQFRFAEELAREVAGRIGSYAKATEAARATTLSELDAIRRRAVMASNGLLATALVALAFWMIVGVITVAEEAPRFRSFGGLPGFLPAAVCLGNIVASLIALMVAGAWKLRRLERYELALAAAIAAMIPLSPHVVLGLPIGIAILRQLRKPEIKKAFQGNAQEQGGLPPLALVRAQTPKPTGFLRRKARSVLRGFGTLFFDSYAAPAGDLRSADDPPGPDVVAYACAIGGLCNRRRL